MSKTLIQSILFILIVTINLPNDILVCCTVTEIKVILRLVDLYDIECTLTVSFFIITFVIYTLWRNFFSLTEVWLQILFQRFELLKTENLEKSP
jgi:hypothetical protein